MILLTPSAISSSMVGCRCAASSAMSLTSSLAPGRREALTSVPPVEEMISRSCVVAPTMPIFSPSSVMMVGGRDLLPMLGCRQEAGAVPASDRVGEARVEVGVAGEVEVGGQVRELGADPARTLPA